MNVDDTTALEHLKGILETAREGIVFADAKGKIISANPAFEALLGYDVKELKGRSFSAFVNEKGGKNGTGV